MENTPTAESTEPAGPAAEPPVRLSHRLATCGRATATAKVARWSVGPVEIGLATSSSTEKPYPVKPSTLWTNHT